MLPISSGGMKLPAGAGLSALAALIASAFSSSFSFFLRSFTEIPDVSSSLCFLAACSS